MTDPLKGADKLSEERVKLFEMLLKRVGIDLPPVEAVPDRAEPDTITLSKVEEQAEVSDQIIRPTTMAARARKPWFHFHRQSTGARLRLFCFPYAGGGAGIFRKWADGLPSEVEVNSVQLPGRGERLNEAPFTRMDQLVHALARNILPYVDKPFAFWGHSMGALVAFELARRLSRDYGLEPVRLFVSGYPAPQTRQSSHKPKILSESQLLDELRRLGGTPEEVLENTELMQLLVTSLRADFELCEAYQYESGPPLKCSIIAYGGLEDQEVSAESLKAWRHQTSATFSVHMFSGGHFFIHTDEAILLKILSQHLHQALSTIA